MNKNIEMIDHINIYDDKKEEILVIQLWSDGDLVVHFSESGEQCIVDRKHQIKLHKFLSDSLKVKNCSEDSHDLESNGKIKSIENRLDRIERILDTVSYSVIKQILESKNG